MPRETEKRPKYVLVALGKLAPKPYAIVNWSDGEVIVLLDDREQGLDDVRELNGIKLKVARKRGAKRQHSVCAELQAHG